MGDDLTENLAVDLRQTDSHSPSALSRKGTVLAACELAEYPLKHQFRAGDGACSLWVGQRIVCIRPMVTRTSSRKLRKCFQSLARPLR